MTKKKKYKTSEKEREYSRRRYVKLKANPEKHAAYKKQQKEWRHALKEEIMEHYGNSKCACCGEDHLEFLAVDHINGDGQKQREQLGMRGGYTFYSWLKQNGWPEGYRVLCHNCNQSLGNLGYCPHDN